MCGRFALSAPAAKLIEFFELDDCADYLINLNIAPGPIHDRMSVLCWMVFCNGVWLEIGLCRPSASGQTRSAMSR